MLKEEQSWKFPAFFRVERMLQYFLSFLQREVLEFENEIQIFES